MKYLGLDLRGCILNIPALCYVPKADIHLILYNMDDYYHIYFMVEL